MFFVLSKMLGPIVDPAIILTFLLVGGIIALSTKRQRLAIYFTSAALGIIVMFGVLPGATWLALPLEKRFQAYPDLPERVAGIIVLGGTERVNASSGWNQPLLSDPTPFAALIELSRRYPGAKLVFTGGSASRTGKFTEADIVRAYLAQLGIPSDRIIYEAKSRNTYENAVFSKRLLQPSPTDLWVLVTQAISVPRAVGTFQKSGWNVIPFPAGYLTSGPNPGIVSANISGGFELGSVAAHEWIGLIAYWLMGYSSEAFPGASSPSLSSLDRNIN
jgi:uncharacterized SAM-binding protein YcdF (DUF218 family)